MITRRSSHRADLGELRDARLSLAMSAAPRGKPHVRAERDTPCDLCPRILRGSEGLRHHKLQKHGIEI